MSGRRPKHQRGHQRGLTLIEILVAMAIIAMMVASVWRGFRATIRGVEITEDVQDRYSTIRNAVDRMAGEISTAYLSFNRPPEEVRHFTLFEGRRGIDGSNLTFSSFSHLRMRKDANEGDQTVIQYFVGPDVDDSSRSHLYRRESKRLTGDRPEDFDRFAPAFVMCEDVEGLELRYWDPLTEDWTDEWRTTVVDGQPDRLPPRVEIRLLVRDEDDEIRAFTTQTVLAMQEKVDASK